MLGLLRSFFGLESGPLSRLDEVRAMSWRQFESIVVEGFRRRGYSVLENSRHADESGIDLVLSKRGQKFLVQCKQWKSAKVDVRPVRELLGLMTGHDANGGFFVTSGTYTDEAREFAKQSNIELMDGPALEQLVLEARLPEPFMDPTEGRRKTGFRKLEAEPACPTCGSAMVKRTAVSGARKGEDFWGCLQFPNCRGTRQAE